MIVIAMVMVVLVLVLVAPHNLLSTISLTRSFAKSLANQNLIIKSVNDTFMHNKLQQTADEAQAK